MHISQLEEAQVTCGCASAGGDNLNLVPGFLDNGLYAVRQFTFPATLATVVADMGVARWYPTTLTLQDGTIMISGGSTAEGGGYGSDSALNEPTYQVRVCSVLQDYLVVIAVSNIVYEELPQFWGWVVVGFPLSTSLGPRQSLYQVNVLQLHMSALM